MDNLRFRCFTEPRFLGFPLERSLAVMMILWSVSLAITPLWLTRTNGPNCQRATPSNNIAAFSNSAAGGHGKPAAVLL